MGMLHEFYTLDQTFEQPLNLTQHIDFTMSSWIVYQTEEMYQQNRASVFIFGAECLECRFTVVKGREKFHTLKFERIKKVSV